MKRKMIKMYAASLLIVGGLVACGQQDVQVGNLNVIPLPQEIVESQSENPFVINSSTTICYEKGNRETGKNGSSLGGLH